MEMQTISNDLPVPKELFFDLCRALSSSQEARAVVADNENTLEYENGWFLFRSEGYVQAFELNDLSKMNQKHMRYALLLNIANTDGLYPCFAGGNPTLGEA